MIIVYIIIAYVIIHILYKFITKHNKNYTEKRSAARINQINEIEDLTNQLNKQNKPLLLKNILDSEFKKLNNM